MHGPLETYPEGIAAQPSKARLVTSDLRSLALIVLSSAIMKEAETGFLMLMVCGALYLQSDPMIWNNLVRLVGRIVGG